MKSKKAQIGTLQSVIIMLIVIGILLGIGFLVLREFQTTMGTDATVVINESATFLVAGFSTAGNITATPCFNTFAVTYIENGTGTVTIPSNNYTYDVISGEIKATSDSDYINEEVNVSYTYLYESTNSSSCLGIQDTETALTNIPTWLSIIVILFIVGILLAIVFRVLPTAGGGEMTGGGFSAGGRGESGTIAEI